MKKLFFAFCALTISAVGASAADMAPRYTKAAPVVAPPLYSWTGCYLGVEGGGNWGRVSTTAASGPVGVFGFPITNDYDLSGGLAGGTVGCNYQVSSWVLGIEGDVSWTNKSGIANDIPPFSTTSTSAFKENWFDTIRGRIGYAWGKVLIFGTGGAAFAGTRTDVCTITLVCVSDSRTRSGWVAGAGVEVGFWDNWTVKLEYLHADFGHANYIDPEVTIGTVGTFRTRSIGLTDDVVRVGINYRFGWAGPVVAKY